MTTYTQLIKICVNDKYESRKIRFCDKQTVEDALSTAMRDLETVIQSQYDKLIKNQGGGN